MGNPWKDASFIEVRPRRRVYTQGVVLAVAAIAFSFGAIIGMGW